MDDAERKAYARHQIADAVSHVDYVGLFEAYPEYAGDEEADLSDEDGRAVDDLIRSATISVAFPDAASGWAPLHVGGGQWAPALRWAGSELEVILPAWSSSEEKCREFIQRDLLGAIEFPADDPDLP